MRSDRSANPDSKYTHTQYQGRFQDFSGDNRDGRGWLAWASLWMSESLRIVKPSGYLLCFCDWRMLPTATDAIQAAGWVWRGVIVWDKGQGARGPHTGYFRHQAEYIVWGTRGVSVPTKGQGGPWPGVIPCNVIASEKDHMTAKPGRLLDVLVSVAPRGGSVLDPFMGSGTTGEACARKGISFLGCEINRHYFSVAKRRLDKAFGGGPLFCEQKELFG